MKKNLYILSIIVIIVLLSSLSAALSIKKYKRLSKGSDNPPQVIITEPKDGQFFLIPFIHVKGTVTDDLGITQFGYIHECEGGGTGSSWPVLPPKTYLPFDIEINLYEGWNRIKVEATDTSGNYGFARITVNYSTKIPGITFNQVDYFFEDGNSCINSYIGQILVEEKKVTSVFGIKTGYLNVFTPLGWVVQNMLITSEVTNPGIEFADYKFHLRDGPPSCINVDTIDTYIEFSPSPLTEFAGELFTTYPVGSISIYIEGPYFAPTLPTNMSFLSNLTIRCMQNNHPNLQVANNQCGPAAVANSLQYLENNYSEKISIPNPNTPGLKGDNTLVGRLDTLVNRSVINRSKGNPVDCGDLLRAKLRYLDENNLGQHIKVKHQSHFIANDVTVGNVTSKNKGKGISSQKVTIEFIINEICAGEDVEILLSWPGGGGHFVEVTGAGYINGTPFIRHVSDLNQTDVDPTDSEGCDTVQVDYVRERADDFLEVIGGSSPTGTLIGWVCSQSPNDPPEKPNKPSGPAKGEPNKSYTYNTNQPRDPNGDIVNRYEWDFDGDEKVDNVTNIPSANYSWSKEGTYKIKVRTRDEYGAVSDWSEPLTVSIPRKRSYIPSPLRIIFKHPPSIP